MNELRGQLIHEMIVGLQSLPIACQLKFLGNACRQIQNIFKISFLNLDMFGKPQGELHF